MVHFFWRTGVDFFNIVNYCKGKKCIWERKLKRTEISRTVCGSKEAASRAVLRKKCSENILQIYWKTPMTKCDFNKVLSNFIWITLWYGYSLVKLLHIFRTPFPKNTSGGLPLEVIEKVNEKLIRQQVDINEMQFCSCHDAELWMLFSFWDYYKNNTKPKRNICTLNL